MPCFRDTTVRRLDSQVLNAALVRPANDRFGSLAAVHGANLVHLVVNNDNYLR